MEIREIRVSDAEFADWSAICDAACHADDPDGPRWREREARVLYEPHEHHDVVLWLASDGGQAVGAAALGLPLRDNLRLGEPHVYVTPDKRRRGIGTALLGVVETAAEYRGRSSLLSYLSSSTQTPQTPGKHFAIQHGFTLRITEIRRVQRSPFLVDQIRQAAAAAKPYAYGYEIVTWRDRAPDELVHEFARLEARLSTDAPLGALEYEGEVWDEERVRKSENRYARMGRGTWNAAAIAPDGRMAGITRVSLMNDADNDGFQDTTIVDPAHRGHRLGLVLKAANFETIIADRPRIQQIWTWNADSNSHMIAINETMGYRVEGWDRAYQRDVRATISDRP